MLFDAFWLWLYCAMQIIVNCETIDLSSHCRRIFIIFQVGIPRARTSVEAIEFLRVYVRASSVREYSQEPAFGMFTDSFLPVQCSGTKAIISGMATRHMIGHHVGTCGTRQRSFVLMYAIHRLYLEQVYLVKRKTPLPSLHQLQSTLSYYSYYRVELIS